MLERVSPSPHPSASIAPASWPGEWLDSDRDGVGDNPDPDDDNDNDGVADGSDNCAVIVNSTQPASADRARCGKLR